MSIKSDDSLLFKQLHVVSEIESLVVEHYTMELLSQKSWNNRHPSMLCVKPIEGVTDAN